ncbi:MAG: hypothetical protein KC462_10135, partial [Cyanobacteria bacterium HKST-UBA05]|nr:hypothetical protein [Cyanobacteria bacterium HKST-UBA05]
MTLTLLDVVCRICRHVGLDPGLDTFSEDDESLALVQFVNEAYERLLDDLPDDIPYKNQRATLTTVAGQRTYDLPSDAWAFDLDDWSLVLDETGDSIPDSRLSWLPRHAVASLDAAYAADDSSRYGRPRIAYVEGDNQVAFYPVPDGGY